MLFQWILLQSILFSLVPIHALPLLLKSVKSWKDYHHLPTLYGVLQTHIDPDLYTIVPKGVTLKIALDLNHGVADASSKTSERFTCSSSLDLVHRLRKYSDVVLVGRGTVQQDNCTLTVRRVLPRVVVEENNNNTNQPLQPTRVIIDPWLKLLQNHNEKQYAILNDGYATTILYHGLSDEEIIVDHGLKSQILQLPTNIQLVRLATIKQETEEILQMKQTKKFLSPEQIMNDLNSRGKFHIMLEGGPETVKCFLLDNFVDRAIIIRAPVHFREPIPSGITDESLEKAGLVRLGTRLCGVDTVEYWTKGGVEWPSPSLESWP